MLSLEPPYYEIGGITVYRDHAVATQFYYTAPPPKISRSGGRLMFDILAYSVDLKHSPLRGTSIPEELGAGFLTMGVDCALPEARRADLLREIATRTGLTEDQIALFPVPYHKGSVRVLALDRFSQPSAPETGAGSATPIKGRPTFVEAVIGSGTPSLLGDLRAIFSLSLSQEGVVFLKNLYESKAAPVGVVYELAFHGLRPSVEVEVTADLARIHQHFGGNLHGQYAWFKADVEAGLDFLRERGAITIKLTSQAVGEAAEKSKELALSLFRDRIVQELFRPITAVPPGVNLAQLLTGGESQHQGIGLTLRVKRTEELKQVNYNFSERAPEERTHAPQGFLQALLDKASLQQRIHKVDLRDDFFELLEVLVTGPSEEEFKALHIRQVEATLSYGSPADGLPPEQQTLLFRPDSTGDKLFAVKRRGRKSLAYTLALTYEFSREAGVDSDALRYTLPPRVQTSRAPRINPYADFGLLEVELEPGRIHPDVREVDVELAYSSPDGLLQAGEQFRLKLREQGEGSRPRWQVRTRDVELSPYTATCSFVFDDNTVYHGAPVKLTEPLLRIDAPFQHERTLLIRPNITAPQIGQVQVEIEYKDEPNRYERRLHLSLTPPFDTRTVAWPIINPAQQQIRYRVTTIEPGFVSEGEWEETEDPSLLVGSVGSRTIPVQVRLIGPPLAEVGLDAVLLKVELLGAGAGGEPQSLLLEGDQRSAEVRLALPPGAPLRYRYQTTAFKSSGQVVESAWKEQTSQLLTISTRAL